MSFVILLCKCSRVCSILSHLLSPDKWSMKMFISSPKVTVHKTGHTVIRISLSLEECDGRTNCTPATDFSTSAALHTQDSTSVTVTVIFITSPSSSSLHSKRNTGNCQKLHHEHVFKTWHGTVPCPWASFQWTTINCLSIRHKHKIQKLLLRHTCDQHFNPPLISSCQAWQTGDLGPQFSMVRGNLSWATESVVLPQKWAEPWNLGSFHVNCYISGKILQN